MSIDTITYNKCKYCGDDCIDESIQIKGEYYCCYGCATLDDVVTKINTSEEFVSIEYKQFDLAQNFRQFVDFQNDKIYKISFSLPAIHCSSCVELLEDLPSFDKRILRAEVNFEQKKCTVVAKKEIKLSFLAQLLSDIGYPPLLSFAEKRKEEESKLNKKTLLKMVVAGFCFGNIMLYSMPHYFGLNLSKDEFFTQLFLVLSVGMSIPVLFYSGFEYLKSAYKSLLASKTHINIPIAIGMLSLWVWSLYEIFSGIGPGYLDSLAGLVFFLLVGKWFQTKIYNQVSFQRSLTEFIPLVVRRRLNGQEFEWTSIRDLREGDLLIVKNMEVVPVDGLLKSPHALIDYSFITGEQIAEEVLHGNEIYTGGKQIGGEIEIEIIKRPDVTKLWSNWSSNSLREKPVSWTNGISKYFTIAVISIAVLSSISWYFIDPSKIPFVFSAVLIVACPCALALSAPFTYGNILRVFSRNSFFVKEADSLQVLGDIQHIVFDKTGTLTQAGQAQVHYEGEQLSATELRLVSSAAAQSNHPLSQRLQQHLNQKNLILNTYSEEIGKGIIAEYKDLKLRLGSAAWLDAEVANNGAVIGVEINNKFKGFFSLKSSFRSESKEVLNNLSDNYNLSLISGDNSSDKIQALNQFENFQQLLFEQKPEDKMERILEIKSLENVAMVGDGINDGIALKNSNFGIAVTESLNGFYPGADAVLVARQFRLLPKFMTLAKYAKRILKIALVFSLLYNLIGVAFAVSGMLTPIIAAILMPISSITVVLLNTMLVRIKAKELELL